MLYLLIFGIKENLSNQFGVLAEANFFWDQLKSFKAKTLEIGPRKGNLATLSGSYFYEKMRLNITTPNMIWIEKTNPRDKIIEKVIIICTMHYAGDEDPVFGQFRIQGHVIWLDTVNTLRMPIYFPSGGGVYAIILSLS